VRVFLFVFSYYFILVELFIKDYLDYLQTQHVSSKTSANYEYRLQFFV